VRRLAAAFPKFSIIDHRSSAKRRRRSSGRQKTAVILRSVFRDEESNPHSSSRIHYDEVRLK
jgi:hypothetical protein